MKTKLQRRRSVTIVATFVSMIGFPGSAAAEQVDLHTLDPLIGEWRGVGQGPVWGNASAERRYERILNDKYVYGFTRTVYPKQEKNENGELHDTVGYFSFDTHRDLLVFRELDNEGIVATYYFDADLSTDRRLVFEAKNSENVPLDWRARVTIEFVDSSEFHEYFELDTGKGEFELYLTTRFLRIPD